SVDRVNIRRINEKARGLTVVAKAELLLYFVELGYLLRLQIHYFTLQAHDLPHLSSVWCAVTQKSDLKCMHTDTTKQSRGGLPLAHILGLRGRHQPGIQLIDIPRAERSRQRF